ncbi:MAG: MFS transporter [Arthrospira sp. PLM2.Bin9]|nr:DUF6798 domain-containing protein [Arthrospira sp. PLM2.Bin9]TVU55026.1 MAG: MFS transporter [Arthrospira sp. PLM2.Bin9]
MHLSLRLGGWKLGAIAFLLISATLVFYGYELGSANVRNQLPAIAFMVDNNLYHRDFYIQEMVGFNPRFFYYHLIAFPAKLGLSIYGIVWAYYIIAFTSFMVGLYAIGKFFLSDSISPTFLVFLGLTAANGTIGFTNLFRPEPIPAVLAMGLTIWGIYYSFRSRWIIGYSLFGLASLLQFLIGIIPGILFIPIMGINIKNKSPKKSIIIGLIIWLIFAACVYFPMKLLSETDSQIISSEQFIYLYAYIRHPHHLIYSQFGLTGSRGWLNFLGFVISALIMMRNSSILKSDKKTNLQIILIVGLGLLSMGYIFVEVIPLATFAKLQLARTSPFIQLLGLIAIALWIKQAYQTGNLPLGCLLISISVIKNSGIVLLVVAITLAISLNYISQLKKTWIIAILTGLMLSISILLCSYFGVIITLMYVGFLIRQNHPSLKSLLINYSSVFLLILTLVLNYHYHLFLGLTLVYPIIVGKTHLHKLLKISLLSLLIITGIWWTPNRLKITATPRQPLEILAQRFQQKSSANALVLVPPSDEKFRFYSQRSVVWSFKSFPFTDRGIIEWEKRMQAITGIVHQSPSILDEQYRQKSASELIAIAQIFEADYILTRRDWHPQLEGNIIDEAENWMIWQIPK